MTYDAIRDTKLPLRNGAGEIPAAGFGTSFMVPNVATKSVIDALEVGFRHLDGAERYLNEDQVGLGIQEVLKAGKVRREELFITTKLWNNNHRPERVTPAFEASRQRLQLDYIDLYLMHTPFAFQAGDDQTPKDESGQVIYDKGVTLLETWAALEGLVDAGKCRNIGLSDVTLKDVQEVVEGARIKPSVVQVECHPYLPEWELLEYCTQHGIVLLAFAALGHGLQPNVLEDAVIVNIAQRLEMTPAQVALSWSAQRGVAFLTTSTTRSHIQENFELATLPEWAMRDMNEKITTRKRLNPVVETGVPGFFK